MRTKNGVHIWMSKRDDYEDVLQEGSEGIYGGCRNEQGELVQ